MELLRPLASPQFAAQSVSYTGTAGSVTGWPFGPQGVMVWATTPCYVEVGFGVTATSSSTPIPANTPIPFEAPQDGNQGNFRVSAIRIDDDGVVYAKPINIR